MDSRGRFSTIYTKGGKICDLLFRNFYFVLNCWSENGVPYHCSIGTTEYEMKFVCKWKVWSFNIYVISHFEIMNVILLCKIARYSIKYLNSQGDQALGIFLAGPEALKLFLSPELQILSKLLLVLEIWRFIFCGIFI